MNKYLFLLHGVPGSGKTTWWKINGLHKFTVVKDRHENEKADPYEVVNFRDKYQIGTDRFEAFCNAGVLMNVEIFMRTGAPVIVVDLPHQYKNTLTMYDFLLEEYNYTSLIVDFSDVPLQECIERDATRNRTVGKEIIERLHKYITDQKEYKNLGIDILTPDEALLKIRELLNKKE